MEIIISQLEEVPERSIAKRASVARVFCQEHGDTVLVRGFTVQMSASFAMRGALHLAVLVVAWIESHLFIDLSSTHMDTNPHLWSHFVPILERVEAIANFPKCYQSQALQQVLRFWLVLTREHHVPFHAWVRLLLPGVRNLSKGGGGEDGDGGFDFHPRGVDRKTSSERIAFGKRRCPRIWSPSSGGRT